MQNLEAILREKAPSQTLASIAKAIHNIQIPKYGKLEIKFQDSKIVDIIVSESFKCHKF